MLQETEDELIRASQEGNLAAFGRLIQPFERQMLALAAGIARDRDEADDIHQDALLAAFRALPRFRMESRFSTWLHRIVINTALSRRRKLQRLLRYVTRPEDGEAAPEQYARALDQPQEALMNEELSRRLTAAIQVLTDRERAAFVLCHQQEFKLQEAAVIMDCGENSIKTLLFRARGKLKEQLKAYYRP